MVLGALAVVAVLVFVVGIGFGGGDAGAGRWQERLEGLGGGSDLRTSDLVLTSGDCAVSGQEIVVRGACVFQVQPTGGRFALGTPTRRGTLENGSSELDLTITVEGQDIAVELEPDEDVDVTVGRSGGTLTLRCEDPLSACEVTLAPA